MCKRKDKFDHEFNNIICDSVCKGIGIFAAVAVISSLISVLNNWDAITFIFGG